MAETENIAKMAELVSTEIFSVFGWTSVGPRNQNWDCARDEHVVVPAKKKKTKVSSPPPAAELETRPEGAGADPKPKKTHPSDVVFRYADPYRDGLIFVQTDLKSYGGDSIKKDEVAGAVRSLCSSTECASVASGWKSLYEEPGAPYQVCGLLFVYNHDEKYSATRFPALVSEISDESTAIIEPHRVFVMGPGDVRYLYTVANNLRTRMHTVGPGTTISAFYPELFYRRSRTVYAPAATIETLLSPWQVFFLTPPVNAGQPRKTLIYYRDVGDSIEEWEYLLAYVLRHHVPLLEGPVEVRAPNAHEKAPAFFGQAKAAILASMYSLPEFKERLDRISYEPITTMTARFSNVALGMAPR